MGSRLANGEAVPVIPLHAEPFFTFRSNPETVDAENSMAVWLRIPALCIFVLTGLGAAAEDKAPKFKVTTRKMDDTVQVQVDGGKVVFSVKSPSGIGSATIERTEDKWPVTVTLKLHLKGLEKLVVSTSKVKLNVAVSSQDGKLRVRVWKDDKEADLLDAKSPYWMEVRIVGADGKPAKELPLKDGHFEMTLPKAFLEDHPKSLSVEWIDFYRG